MPKLTKAIFALLAMPALILPASIALAGPAAPAPVCRIEANVLNVQKQKTRNNNDYYAVKIWINKSSLLRAEGEMGCAGYAKTAQSAIITPAEYKKLPIKKRMAIGAEMQFGGDEYLGGLFLRNIKKIKRSAADELQSTVEAYLADKLGEKGYNGEVFAAYEVLDKKQSGNNLKLDVWALISEYYSKNGKTQMGSASSLPVSLTIKKQGGQFIVLKHKTPRDGNLYAADIKKMFSAKAAGLALSGNAKTVNQRIDKLEKEINKEKDAFFG